jgi:hypothetical protein
MIRLVWWFIDRRITMFSKGAGRTFLDEVSFPRIAQLEASSMAFEAMLKVERVM